MPSDALGKLATAVANHLSRLFKQASENRTQKSNTLHPQLRPAPISISRLTGIDNANALKMRLAGYRQQSLRQFGTLAGFFGRPGIGLGLKPKSPHTSFPRFASSTTQASGRATMKSNSEMFYEVLAHIYAGRHQCPITSRVIKGLKIAKQLQLGSYIPGHTCRAALLTFHARYADMLQGILAPHKTVHPSLQSVDSRLSNSRIGEPTHRISQIHITVPNLSAMHQQIISSFLRAGALSNDRSAREDFSIDDPDNLMLHEKSHGCYLEFPVEFSLNMPSETHLSEEILTGIINSVDAFEKNLQAFKQDLMAVFDLGELAITFVREKNVVRVHFPNCDVARLQQLCSDKNISSAKIFSSEGPMNDPGICYPSVSFSNTVSHDTLHDCNSGVSSMDCEMMESDDSGLSVFSDDSASSRIMPLGNDKIMRPASVAGDHNTNVDIYDDFTWA